MYLNGFKYYNLTLTVLFGPSCKVSSIAIYCLNTVLLSITNTSILY